MLRGAFALEVELDIVEGKTDLVKRGLWIEVGIARGEQGADVAKTPPLGLFCFLRPTEGLANHLHQVVQFNIPIYVKIVRMSYMYCILTERNLKKLYVLNVAQKSFRSGIPRQGNVPNVEET